MYVVNGTVHDVYAFVDSFFMLLGQGPVLGMEFFVFRKMECPKQINHLLCGWLELLQLTVENLLWYNNVGSPTALKYEGGIQNG